MRSTSGLAVPGAPNSTVGTLPITVDLDPMLSGFIPGEEHSHFYPIYRDMYYNDPVCGSTVDLQSLLPFGDFSLGGCTDRKVLAVYEEAVSRLNVRSYMQDFSVDYLAMGGGCSSLVYDAQRNMFFDFMPHSIENLKVTQLPFYSQEPILTVTFPRAIVESVSGNSPRLHQLRNRVGPKLFDAIRSGKMELDPASTIFLARRSFSTNHMGTSLLRRCLPYYLIEKGLYRGTLVESQKRQRGILHATLGDGDQWDPTTEELEFFTNLLNDADSDPVGAVLVTKQGVQIDEFRQGGDFWKCTDFSESVFNMKLRALGVSEAFLSGDANYSTGDNALSVFLDSLRSYRELITYRLLLNKLFPLIAVTHGFGMRNGKVRKVDFDNTKTPEEIMYDMNDGTKLFIPAVHWSKQLKPEGDTQYMEMLQTLSDKGVPVPLRMMAAAGGMSLDDLMRQKDDDLAVRKSVFDYKSELDALTPPPAEGMSESSFFPSGRSVTANRGRVPLLDRNFQGSGEVWNYSPTGKPSLVVNQKAAQERINRRLSKQLADLNKRRK